MSADGAPVHAHGLPKACCAPFVTPMFVFGGIFYPGERLPDWAQAAAWLTPLYHLVNIARDLATGPEAAAVAAKAARLLAVTVVLFCAVPARALRRRLVA